MKNNKIINKYNISKKTRILILIQMILLIVALFISLFGVFRSLDLVNSTNRIIIYGGQALICFATIIFGVYHFNKQNTKYFRGIIMAYALLEAVRVSLLQTNGIEEIYSFLAKFILVLLALDAALLSERIDKKEGLNLSLTMVGLEILLYIIFLIGFPAVRTRLLYMIVPLVGILMAGSMCIFITGRLEQNLYSKEKNKK
jgi:hypothetical protein